MIRAWRLVPSQFARQAFDGEGARLFGGRWNHEGNPAVYLADSLALAALEYFVHLGTAHSKLDLRAFKLSIPPKLIQQIKLRDLPENWRHFPAPEATKDFGSHWLSTGKFAVLQLPSVAIPVESNFMLNPIHPDFKKIKIELAQKFSFDSRMWK